MYIIYIVCNVIWIKPECSTNQTLFLYHDYQNLESTYLKKKMKIINIPNHIDIKKKDLKTQNFCLFFEIFCC